MNTYIGSTTKTHLIRGALYLLLLFTICVIPFALGQHNPRVSQQSQVTLKQPMPVQLTTPTPTSTCLPFATPSPWLSRTNYPQNASEVAVASDGSAIYAFGGNHNGGRTVQAYRYNYATDAWTAIANLLDPNYGAGAEYGQNGKFYVIGGGYNRVYDIGTNSWSYAAVPPTQVIDGGHAYWNGKIYIIGGISAMIYNTVSAYDIATDTWSNLAPLPQAEYGVASAAINGKIYVANGMTAGGMTNNLYIYDIVTDTWSAGPSSPVASWLVGSTVIAGKLYMIGGGNSNGVTANTYLYNPVSNSWSQGPSLNVARLAGNAATINIPGGQTAVVVGGMQSALWLYSVEASTVSCPMATPTPIPTSTPTPCSSVGAWTDRAPHPIAVSGHAVASVGGNVYSFGGIANNVALANAYKYDPITNAWTPIASLPEPRYWFSAASDGTYIYLLGGVNENGLPRANLWRYDPISNTYNTNLPSYTIATYFHASAYLNGKIYRIAGRGMGTDFHVEVYNIATNSWSMAANFPGADQMLMAAALGGYIYAGGGNSIGCYRYDPVSDTWTSIASLPVVRSLAASAVYNGRWILAGGDVTFVPSNSVIAWDPITNTWNNLPNMVQARDSLTGATVGQSFYAIAGGSAPGIGTNDNQQYTETPCGTPTPTATSTARPSATATATPTATATATPIFTATPTASPTATHTATPHATPTPRIAPTVRPRPTPIPRP